MSPADRERGAKDLRKKGLFGNSANRLDPAGVKRMLRQFVKETSHAQARPDEEFAFQHRDTSLLEEESLFVLKRIFRSDTERNVLRIRRQLASIERRQKEVESAELVAAEKQELGEGKGWFLHPDGDDADAMGKADAKPKRELGVAEQQAMSGGVKPLPAHKNVAEHSGKNGVVTSGHMLPPPTSGEVAKNGAAHYSERAASRARFDRTHSNVIGDKNLLKNSKQHVYKLDLKAQIESANKAEGVMDDYLFKIEHFLKQEDRTHNREHVSSVALYRDYQILVKNALDIVRRRGGDFVHAARRKLLHKHWQDTEFQTRTRVLKVKKNGKKGVRKLMKAGMVKAVESSDKDQDSLNVEKRRQLVAAEKNANDDKHGQFMRHLEKKTRINKSIQRNLMSLINHHMASPSANAVRQLTERNEEKQQAREKEELRTWCRHQVHMPGSTFDAGQCAALENELDNWDEEIQNNNRRRLQDSDPASSSNAAADFAKQVVDAIPDKTVISQNIETLSSISLYRGSAASFEMERSGGNGGGSDQYEYFPADRWKKNTMEQYESPQILDLHIAMFVIPNRTSVYDLCPNMSNVDYETMTNTFSTKQRNSNLARFYNQWNVEESHIKMQSCTFNDYQFTSVADLLTNYTQTALAAAQALGITTTAAPTTTVATTTAVGTTTAAGGRRLEAKEAESQTQQQQKADKNHVPNHPYGSVNGLHPDHVARHIKTLEVLVKLNREDYVASLGGTRHGMPSDHPEAPANKNKKNRAQAAGRKLSEEAINLEDEEQEEDAEHDDDSGFLAFHRRLASSEAVQEAAAALGIDTKICLNTQALTTMSLDKYRLYCASAMRPKKEMHLQFMAPLSGNWLMPEQRTQAFGKAAAAALANNDLARVTGNGNNIVDSEIERSVDLEMTYYFNYDVAFLKAEKEYMEWGAGNDFIDGKKRMWAAEPLVKGRANCVEYGNNTFAECGYGIPANVPVMYPDLTLSVDREKTKQIVKEAHPRYWPWDDMKKVDKLLDKMEKILLDMKSEIKRMTATEDGSLALKPNQKIIMRIKWQIAPVYEERYDFWNEIAKLTYSYIGGIASRLESVTHYEQSEMIELVYWDHSISGISIEYAPTDYTDRKTSKVRLIFEVDQNSQRYFKILAVKYGFIDLLTDIGSWAGLMLAAYIILWWYQWLAKPFGTINSHDARHASDILLKRSDELYGQKKLNKLMHNHPDLFAELEAEAGLSPSTGATTARTETEMDMQDGAQAAYDDIPTDKTSTKGGGNGKEYRGSADKTKE